jgi:putative sporulation protein YyaC
MIPSQPGPQNEPVDRTRREASIPFRLKLNSKQLVGFFQSIYEEGVRLEAITFLCIGTDRSTGDALGPLVGTFLEEAGYRQVIGTLSMPCDGSNMVARVAEMPAGGIVIAIDACLGKPSSVGQYQVANQPIEPGKSVGKRLPPVGDYSIAAIVNVDGPKKYWILQNTSLHQVVRMAKEIVFAIRKVFPV